MENNTKKMLKRIAVRLGLWFPYISILQNGLYDISITKLFLHAVAFCVCVDMVMWGIKDDWYD